MNVEIYISNIKSLKKNYIIHLILQGIIIIYNYIFLKEIFWLHKLIYYLYISISIFIVIYIIIPIIPFIFLLLKKFSRKLIRRFKLLSLLFCILVLITGLSITIILMVNALETTDFCKECPFNLENPYINKIFSEYYSKNFIENNLEEECKNRRCMFNNKLLDSQYLYEYICNYDPQSEFEEIKNVSNSNETIEQIKCTKIDNNGDGNYFFVDKNINSFIDFCKTYNEYYICKRVTLPKNYSLKENFKCPKKNYLRNLAFFCMISVLFNLILGFIPWKWEYNKYNNILKDLIRSTRQGTKSLNSTQNISKIQKIEESFKKEPTQTIIIYNESEGNISSDNKVNKNYTKEEYFNTEDNLDEKDTKKEKSKNKNKSKNKVIIDLIDIKNKNTEIKKTEIKNNEISNNKNKKNEIKNNEKNNDIKISKIPIKRPIASSKNLYKYNQKLNNKCIHEKINNNDKMKKDENNSIKIFKINNSPTISKKKENKKIKEIKEKKEKKDKEKDKDEDKFVRSNSYRVSYFSDRNILEESKNVPDM